MTDKDRAVRHNKEPRMKTRTAAVAALAALAIPATSQATKPAEPGKQGRDNAAQKQSAAQTQSVGLSLDGTGLATLPVTHNKLTGAQTLHPTSANQHARRLLDLTKTEIAGTDTVSFGETDDAAKVRYVGLTATDALQ